MAHLMSTSLRPRSDRPLAPTAPNASSIFLNETTAVANLAGAVGLPLGGLSERSKVESSISPKGLRTDSKESLFDRSGRWVRVYLMRRVVSWRPG